MATFANRVRETTTVTGTGSATLLGAVTGWQAFNGPFVSSDQPYYAIVGQGTNEWEVGKATFTAPSTLARTVVLASSNGGAAVNFSAGTKDVWNDVPASIIELILTSVQNSRQVISGDGISGGGDLSADRTLKINAAPSTIASATTTDLGSVTTINVVISGTTTITGFGTGASKFRVGVFSGALLLTHNATSLILPGGANITTVAGDRFVAVSDASGNWTVLDYIRATGKALTTSIVASDVSAAVLAALPFGPFTSIASATTTNLSTVATIGVNITGTTTITGFGTGANLFRMGKFAGALTLTHNATSLILPGGANITTAAGDTFIAMSDGSGNWTVVDYTKASGAAIVSASATSQQSFTGSGTWTKPGSGTVALIECWGGGGAGGKSDFVSNGTQGGGGGGGGYSFRWVPLSSLGATETVTIGAGGAAQSTAATNGAVGGDTTFGSWLTAYGGGGGGFGPTSTAPGGGGGGQLGAGTASSSTGAGSPRPAGAGANAAYGDGGVSGAAGTAGMFHGGGGGSGATTTGGAGGASVYGGGGGGGSATTTAGAGGASKFGGNGGAGAIGAANATAGSQPGGGGGASRTGTSGAGGAGKCVVTVY